MYYKVVTSDLCSTTKGIIYPKFVVQYKIKEWVSPNIINTPLYVFNKFEAINNWFDVEYMRHRLFVCEVENPTVKPMLSFCHSSDVEEFWNSNCIKNYLCADIDGIVGCSRVKLVKEIKKEDIGEYL